MSDNFALQQNRTVHRTGTLGMCHNPTATTQTSFP